MGTIVFSLVMFLNNGTSHTAAVYPTLESCRSAAQQVHLDLAKNPDRFRVGVACIPSNQVSVQDIHRQMTELFSVIKQVDQTQGLVPNCPR